jgi:hypothetical protein
MRTLMMMLMLIFAGTNVACASPAYDRYGYDRSGYDNNRYANYGYDDIARAAHQLENAAEHFHQQLRRNAGYGHTTRDAKKFASAARHFHRQVERGGSYGHIRNDYAELVNAYAHVRREFGGRHDLHHDRHFQGDFGQVERAFDNLNRAIGYAQSGYSRYRDHDRYGRRYDGHRRYDRD